MEKKENNKMNFISAVINLIISLVFLLLAVFQKDIVMKFGFGVVSLCMFISGIGFLYTYKKNKHGKK